MTLSKPSGQFEFIEYPSNGPADSSHAFWLKILLGTIILYSYAWLSGSPFASHSDWVQRFIWYIFVQATPWWMVHLLDQYNQRLYGDSAGSRIKDARSLNTTSKSEVLEKALSLGYGSLAAALRDKLGISYFGTPAKGDALQVPAGLGNIDNSCYQNSVIQCLASVNGIQSFLSQQISRSGNELSNSTVETLHTTLMKLNHPSYYGKHIWTPTKLKSMNSWAQQDAQEYFSKISEDIDKEIQALARRHAQSEMDLARCLSFIDAEVNPEGHNGPKGCEQEPGKTVRPDSRNPFEGAVASRVACLKCGNTDGLSLSPFICLTLALGTELETDLKACLNGYSELETINGVECARCTLERRKLKTETALQKLADTQTERTPAMDKLEESLSTHLATLEECLEADDISNKLVSEKCRIPKDQYVASEKTKQMVIARAPNSLVIHINRSMIDMYTGMLRKNSARVRFPTRFDLGPWCLGSGTDSDSSNATADTWSMDPTVSLVGRSSEKTAAGYNLYELRSLVAHYGRHENGHFVCFRKFSTSNDGIFRSDVPDAKADCSKQSINREEERWWCLNDETVTPVEEDLVLQQSGAFLLFYERIKDNHSWSAPNGTAQAKTSPVADQEDENHIADTTQLIDADIDAKDHHLTQTSLSANDPLPNGSSSPTHTSPPPSSAASGDRVNLRTKSNPLSINGADQDDPALPASEQRISTESLSLSSKTTDAAASHKSSVSIQSSSIAAN